MNMKKIISFFIVACCAMCATCLLYTSRNGERWSGVLLSDSWRVPSSHSHWWIPGVWRGISGPFFRKDVYKRQGLPRYSVCRMCWRRMIRRNCVRRNGLWSIRLWKKMCIRDRHNTVSIISAGWDPGSDSIVRTMLEAIAPKQPIMSCQYG